MNLAELVKLVTSRRRSKKQAESRELEKVYIVFIDGETTRIAPLGDLILSSPPLLVCDDVPVDALLGCQKQAEEAQNRTRANPERDRSRTQKEKYQ